jgi:hypothetical protein
MKKILAALCLILLMALGAPLAQADVILTSGNSQVKIDPANWYGLYSWTVNGTEQMYNQWFYYRVGSSGPERSIDTLSAPGIVTSGTDQAELTYIGSLISVSVKYALVGGSGSEAKLTETVSITNISTSSLALHFFQYTDFDLNGTPGGDVGEIYGPKHNRVDQKEGSVMLSEKGITPPSYYQISDFPDIILSLTDADPTTLNDTGGPLGPGDLAWALEWDFNLDSGESFLISKDKMISTVPIPPAALLFGTGLLGLVGIGLRRKK